MVELTDLKYCVRLKHSKDMPLKKPRKNCAFKGSQWLKRFPKIWHLPEECVFHPAHLRYCKDNDIDIKQENFNIRFRCVLCKE